VFGKASLPSLNKALKSPPTPLIKGGIDKVLKKPPGKKRSC